MKFAVKSIRPRRKAVAKWPRGCFASLKVSRGGYHPPALIGGNCKNQMNMVRHNAIFVYCNTFIVFSD